MKKLISIMTDTGLVEGEFDSTGMSDSGLIVKALHELIMANLGQNYTIESIIIKEVKHETV